MRVFKISLRFQQYGVWYEGFDFIGYAKEENKNIFGYLESKKTRPQNDIRFIEGEITPYDWAIILLSNNKYLQPYFCLFRETICEGENEGKWSGDSYRGFFEDRKADGYVEAVIELVTENIEGILKRIDQNYDQLKRKSKWEFYRKYKPYDSYRGIKFKYRTP